jgi:hypothetical protein
MSDVISLAERRNAKIRDRMLTFALNGEPVILETRKGVIRADRLICRENAAEIYNAHGESFVVVSYGDIRDVRPGVTPQISVVSEAGDWVLPSDGIARTEPSRVLAFARRGQLR